MRRVVGLLLIICILFTSFGSFAMDKRTNPSRKEVERIIERVANRRGIPSVILKAIARVESVFQQYKPNGSVFTGPSGSIGVMQVYNRGAGFDDNKLRYDIEYNIEAGAEMLLRKWNGTITNPRIPTIGNMDPNILEHWYFAIWAYNGWLGRNNPNSNNKHTYPELIYKIIREEYGQEITPINPKLLPTKGVPSGKTHFDTPKNFHYGDIPKYTKEDIVKVNVNSRLSVRNKEGNKVIGHLNNGETLDILQGPIVIGGYHRYKIKSQESNTTGWVAGNYLIKTGEKEIIPEDLPEGLEYKDIYSSWCYDYVVDLYNKEVLDGRGEELEPNKFITRQQLAVILTKAFDLENEEYEFQYEDKKKLDNWAIDYVEAAIEEGYMYGYVDGKFRPDYYVTRQEMTEIITNIIGIDEDIEEAKFKDSDKISEKYNLYISNAHSKGIMTGNTKGFFRPLDYMTRAEAIKVISNILNMKE